MGLSRADNSDNRKHGPATTKADASMPAQFPHNMGDWDAPGVQIVTDNDDLGGDTPYENYNPGPITSDPVSKPVG